MILPPLVFPGGTLLRASRKGVRACKGAHNQRIGTTLFTGQRERERKRERKRERERERGGERDKEGGKEIKRERERVRFTICLFYFKWNDGCLGTF